MRTEPIGSAARFFGLLSALLLAQLSLVAWVLVVGWPADGWPVRTLAMVVATAFGGGLLALLRALPVLFLLSWPLLRLRAPRARLLAVGGLWSLFVLAQVALEQYFLAARTPLGADLFGYSLAEIRTTIADGTPVNAAGLLGWVLPLAVLCAALYWLAQRAPRTRRNGPALALLALALASWWPTLATPRWLPSDATRDLAISKGAYFVGDSLRLWRTPPTPVLPAMAAAGALGPEGFEGVPRDPAHPFLHLDATPDTLGPYFAPTRDGRPPNLVLIVVEGLGRSFSGPDASLGSFTPFLDTLAARSLYFENFLANQGRTFGVLPSLLGSLPVAERGFLALGARMPAHPGLFNVLQRQGYRSSFYNGTDSDFDNERAYMQLQGVDTVVDLRNFGAGYARNPLSSWGYPDRELISRVLADTPRLQSPFVLLMQTISMHTSYRFPGQDAYRALFEARLDALAVPMLRRAGYREHADIYSTILYTDDQLRRYFAQVAHAPWYADTIFVITGDHRLPEIPMDSHVERYHVPLIIFSPLLLRPARIGAVSSHLDVTPSLLALLANRYGLKRPAQAAWTGSGLDVAPGFRNLHDIPLKHTKTSAPDFISGRWLLHDGLLSTLDDGIRAAPVSDANMQARISQRLARYTAANARFVQDLVLDPGGGMPRLVAYSDAPAAKTALATAVATMRPDGLGLDAVRLAAGAGALEVTALFANGDATASASFVPLAILADAHGRELHERSGIALRLQARESREIRLQLDTAGLAPGRYYVSVTPSDPGSGKALGRGRFHIPFDLGDAR